MKERGTKLYLQDRTEAKKNQESGQRVFLTFLRKVLSIVHTATSRR